MENGMKPTIQWQIASITSIKPETPTVKTFTLRLPAWMRHRAGQHYDIRLTAQDGYQTQRSYSIASEPERQGEVDLTVERIEDGEVSTYLHDVAVIGDRVEVRGPIGGYFVWDVDMTDPLLLIAGGSGIVPLMSMIRHRTTAGGLRRRYCCTARAILKTSSIPPNWKC
jgi:ferredoxin-NADP reductase